MTPVALQLPFGSGILETAAKVAVAAGTIVLLLALVAMVAFAYKSLRGDGIEWPDDVDESDATDDGVVRGDDDDEWDYY